MRGGIHRTLRLVGFEHGDRRLKAGAAFAATKLDDVPIHAHFSDVQGFLMVAGTGPQLGARAFLAQFRIPHDASNGSNRQAMPGFTVHAKDTDGIGHGEQFHVQRQGVDGKALLQECAGLKNVTHTVCLLLTFTYPETRRRKRGQFRTRKNRLPGFKLISVSTRSQISVSACFSPPTLEDLGGFIKREDVVKAERSGVRIQRIVGVATESHHGSHAFSGLEHAPSQLVDTHGVEFILGQRIAIDPRCLTS